MHWKVFMFHCNLQRLLESLQPSWGEYLLFLFLLASSCLGTQKVCHRPSSFLPEEQTPALSPSPPLCLRNGKRLENSSIGVFSLISALWVGRNVFFKHYKFLSFSSESSSQLPEHVLTGEGEGQSRAAKQPGKLSCVKGDMGNSVLWSWLAALQRKLLCLSCICSSIMSTKLMHSCTHSHTHTHTHSFIHSLIH